MQETPSNSSSMEMLHWLLYRALIDIRHEGQDKKCASVFGLADLFHSIPLQLQMAAKANGTYDTILKSLIELGRARNCDKWLENQMASFRETNVAEDPDS